MNNELMKQVDTHFPEKVVKFTHKDKPFITQELKKHTHFRDDANMAHNANMPKT